MNPVTLIEHWYAGPDKLLLAESVVWHLAPHFPFGGTYYGKDSVFEQVFAPLLVRYQDWHITLDEVFDAGGQVMATGTYRGHYNSPQGNHLQLSRFVHLWQIKQGQIVSFRQYVEDNFQ